MNVTISHITAAYHWLMTPMDGHGLEALERSSVLGNCPTRITQLGYFDLDDYRLDGLRPELLTTDSGACPAPERYQYHTSCRDFPEGAFVVLEAGVQTVSPELSFWQMSKTLPLGELVKYGDALCGRYSYTVGPDGHLLKRRAPLTTAKRLERFARKMGNCKRHPKVFRALKAIVDGAESPMESCCVILLCLKRQYGGYGIPLPKMGHVVHLDEEAKRLTRTETCRCDMYWPEANYDLEYDSDESHGPDVTTQDSLRRTAIKHMGIRVGELRKVQVLDPELFDIAARFLAKDLKVRITKRSDELEFKYSIASTELRQQLFAWERASSTMDRSPLRIGDLDW